MRNRLLVCKLWDPLGVRVVASACRASGDPGECVPVCRTITSSYKRLTNDGVGSFHGPGLQDGAEPSSVNVSVAVSFVSFSSPEAEGRKGATMLGGYSLSQELIRS